jgi:hypothetical protein
VAVIRLEDDVADPPSPGYLDTTVGGARSGSAAGTAVDAARGYVSTVDDSAGPAEAAPAPLPRSIARIVSTER